MQIHFETKSDVCLITLAGRCEGFDYLDLQKQMDQKINDDTAHFVFDVSDVEYVSSTALATICSYLPDCEERSGGIVFLGANERVLAILECLKITAIIPVVADFQAALASLGKA